MSHLAPVAVVVAAYDRMHARGVAFLTVPRTEPYGRVAVFLDVAGNRWDLSVPPRCDHRRLAATT